jgi:hypothetical protein
MGRSLANDMGSGAMIYIPSFIRIRSGLQKLIAGGGSHKHTHTARRAHKLTFIFFSKQGEKDKYKSSERVL